MYLDQTCEPRTGEAIDLPRLIAYLANHLPIPQLDWQVRQFPGGHSNLTYLLSHPDGQKWVLRKPPPGTKAASAHDMGRECRTLTALDGLYPLAPQVKHYCEDSRILGQPFYIMSYVAGVILRRDYPNGWVEDTQTVAKQCQVWLDGLIKLHKLPTTAGTISSLGKPHGYRERQLAGWHQRYLKAHTPDAPDFAPVIAYLEAHLPTNHRAAVIHNDYKLDNVVWQSSQPTKMIGVLDWEMATLGDPLMDLGNSLAYWVEAGDGADLQKIRMMPTNAAGAWQRQQIIDYYQEHTGWDCRQFEFYYVFGLFRLAGICQQIYYRYYHKQTDDPRFAKMIGITHSLRKQCATIIN